MTSTSSESTVSKAIPRTGVDTGSGGERTPGSGITRRLVRVILLQLLFISLTTALGVAVAAKVFEQVTMRTALEGEAAHFWSRYLANSAHPVPNTDNLRGYLVVDGEAVGAAGSGPPEVLTSHPEGYGKVNLNGQERLVLVDSRTAHGKPTTVYLIFDAESVAALSFYFGVVPLSLALIVIYLASYIGFRQTRAAISPMVALANRLRRFHPQQNQLVDLQLSDLHTENEDDEVTVLVNSLNQFTDEINELIERERRFTRDASHELRTPLTVIQGSAEFLSSTMKGGPNQQRSLDRILRTVRDMNELVTALLILARGSNRVPEVSEVDIDTVVENQLEQLDMTHNRDKHVSVKVDLVAPCVVTATPQLVEAVIGNLLRNAFNYTRKGEVRVVIESDAIEIRNRGEGVQPVDEETLFTPFSRGNEGGEAVGYGVGLDIVKRLCELFGWRVRSHYTAQREMVFRVEFQTTSAAVIRLRFLGQRP